MLAAEQGCSFLLAAPLLGIGATQHGNSLTLKVTPLEGHPFVHIIYMLYINVYMCGVKV